MIDRYARWRGRAAFLGGLALLAAAGAAPAQSGAPAERLTLDEARDRAFAHAPQVVQAAGAVTTAGAAERSAFGAFLPTLSASAGSGLSGSNTGGVSDPLQPSSLSESYSAGLSASWDVYTGGRRGSQRASAGAAASAASAELVSQRASVGLAVERAYYDVLRAGELEGVAEARIERAREAVAAAEQRRTLGSATRSDALRAELELNTARGAHLQARTQREAAELALGRLVGADGPVGAAPGGAPDRILPATEAEALAARISDGSPSVDAAQASVLSAVAGVDAARSRYLPALRLSSGYSWSNREAAFTDGRTSWSLSLGLSLPLFDGFQREEAVVRARVQQESAEARLADAERSVRADAARALGSLRLAEERITLAGQAVEAAREDLRVQRERYTLGNATILEMTTSQTALVQAESDLVAARYDYQLARAELEALAGVER